ncbi:MAG: pyridoxal-phosphate dependent enzyme [Elusimicrobia bacterium]|nr:pyridoxal-phosphate dependent enzyme [Elusimicrobiota bacterium]
MKFNNILETVGRTPLIRLNRIAKDFRPRLYVKAEFFNPGGSVKDRIAVRMIAEAEQQGLLKPGGTIIEGTSGNTGIGLALVAALKGYKIIFTITDKQSREKINFLKALGAEVIVCPTAVAPEDPRSYYSIAKKLAKEIPGAYYPNQYENPENPMAHYLTTGPEIWEDTEGEVTHFVAGMGTGGTLSGAGRFLKEKNPQVKVVGVDPLGSIYYDYFHHKKIIEAKTYVIEGIGEDILPSTMQFEVVDDVLRVTDRESFLATRRLANWEGIFTGGSGGSAIAGGLRLAESLSEKDFVVILLPDTGMRYLSKIYNDEWMKEHQYHESEFHLNVADLVQVKRKQSRPRKLSVVHPQEFLWEALGKMRDEDISQIPVFENGELVGSVYEDEILELALSGKNIKKMIVRESMSPPLPLVDSMARVETLIRTISPKQPAVLVEVKKGDFEIITKYDILHQVARLTST